MESTDSRQFAGQLDRASQSGRAIYQDSGLEKIKWQFFGSKTSQRHAVKLLEKFHFPPPILVSSFGFLVHFPSSVRQNIFLDVNI